MIPIIIYNFFSVVDVPVYLVTVLVVACLAAHEEFVALEEHTKRLKAFLNERCGQVHVGNEEYTVTLAPQIVYSPLGFKYGNKDFAFKLQLELKYFVLWQYVGMAEGKLIIDIVDV